MSRRLRGSVEASIEVRCGFCGELWELSIEATSGENQRFIEDCPTCCRPNEVRVTIDEETLEPHGEASYEG